MLTIGNAGQDILESNFWDTDYAKKGLFYLTWNAGAARLLVPDSQHAAIREMQTARRVEIERIAGGLAIYFDDDSAFPYSLQIGSDQTDRLVKPDPREFPLSLWVRGPRKVATWQTRIVR